MASSRLSLAFEEAVQSGTGSDSGTVAVFEPVETTDLAGVPAERLQVVSRHATIHAALSDLDCRTEPAGPLSAAVVIVPRAKALGRALIARAVAACPGGTILVDGQKTDGVDPLFRACKARIALAGQMTKAHGRAFWFRAAPVFDDWASAPADADGFETRPGVFSADGIDPASALLSDYLPATPGRQVADLGAGWGYLGHAILQNASVEHVHLVEDDAVALDCARRNVPGPRAHFHWADATRWTAPEPLDTILMNPPFHQGRKGAPDLGQAFIANAARLLRPVGQLVLVANRHLPYEDSLARHFARFDELGGTGRFKILRAERPARGRR